MSREYFIKDKWVWITMLTHLPTLTLEGAASMVIYLYKKTHNKTGLVYLGKTFP